MGSRGEIARFAGRKGIGIGPFLDHLAGFILYDQPVHVNFFVRWVERQGQAAECLQPALVQDFDVVVLGNPDRLSGLIEYPHHPVPVISTVTFDESRSWFRSCCQCVLHHFGDWHGLQGRPRQLRSALPQGAIGHGEGLFDGRVLRRLSGRFGKGLAG